MQCERVREHLTERLTQPLAAETEAAVDEHLRSCAFCRVEAMELSDTWQQLGTVPSAPADSAHLRARFTALVDAHERGRAAASPGGLNDWRPRSSRTWLAAAAAVVLFAGGLGIGRFSAPAPAANDADLSAMRGELRELRQLVTLSLLQQQSASERLKGVTWSQQLEEPGSDVTTALLDTLMHDPNVNVRLASIDALKRFAERQAVRQGAIEALGRQTAPLVQIALIDFVVDTKTREAATTLQQLSQDANADAAVRERALQGLSKLRI